MKKIILSSIALLAFGFANAQDGASFGVKGGIDMVSAKTEYTGYDIDFTTGAVETYTETATVSTTGFYVGGFAEFGIADKFKVQPGINYHTASKDGYKLDFLSIPVLVEYEIAEKFNLEAGPSLYYSLNSDDSDKTRFNLGVGASYNFTENFFVEPRYDIGLTGDTKVSHFLIGVGYKF
ncbi:MAG: PorT family protein [Flavobacterium sp.]|nr:PorT family protein [Flavobacterium sp.]